jgi:hypothetical protein
LTINDWSTVNYNPLLDAAKKISGNSDLATELLHYSLEQLLTKTNVQEIVDSGGAQFWVIRTMMNSWRSTTSKFYVLYRKSLYNTEDISYLVNDVVDEDAVDVSEISNQINRELDALYWYDRDLFRMYVNESHTISSLSRATKIPRTSISLTINRVKSYLKTKIK